MVPRKQRRQAITNHEQTTKENKPTWYKKLAILNGLIFLILSLVVAARGGYAEYREFCTAHNYTDYDPNKGACFRIDDNLVRYECNLGVYIIENKRVFYFKEECN